MDAEYVSTGHVVNYKVNCEMSNLFDSMLYKCLNHVAMRASRGPRVHWLVLI